MPKLPRECKLCGVVFDPEYAGTGRPRELCFSCQPKGFKVVYPAPVLKLRRVVGVRPEGGNQWTA
jgi:hypothetical protein